LENYLMKMAFPIGCRIAKTSSTRSMVKFEPVMEIKLNYRLRVIWRIEHKFRKWNLIGNDIQKEN